MHNQQNGCVILWLTWQKYESMYRLLTCTKKTFRNQLTFSPRLLCQILPILRHHSLWSAPQVVRGLEKIPKYSKYQKLHYATTGVSKLKKMVLDVIFLYSTQSDCPLGTLFQLSIFVQQKCQYCGRMYKTVINSCFALSFYITLPLLICT